MNKPIKQLPPMGRYPVQRGPDIVPRIAQILWGPINCGKTTFAATAPGEKLWLSFGDNEHVSVSHRSDVSVVELHGLGFEELFQETSGDNPFGLDGYLAKNKVDTIVCDSLTAIAYKGLQRAVAHKVGASRRDGFTPTMEAPGMSAYGGRNANVIELMQGLLRVTAKHNVNIVFTAHEDDPVLTRDGNIDYIKIALGGKIMNETIYRISEVWHIRQLQTGDREREIYIRPYNQRRPMKTRMFDQKGNPFFRLVYDPDKPDNAPGQMTIKGFHEQWLKNGKRRIPVPDVKKGK